MPNYAAGSGHRLCYKPEATWAASTIGAGFKNVRLTSCSLGLKKGSMTSNEIRSDRQTADVRHGIKSISGDIGFEMSPTCFDDFIMGLLMNPWAGAGPDYIQNGVTRKSFAFEQAFLDQDVPSYCLYSGIMINSMSLSMRPGAIVSGSWSVVGKTCVTATTSQVTGPADPDYTQSPFDSFSGAVVEGGSVAIGPPLVVTGGTPLAIVTGLDLTVTNNLTANEVVGSNSATGVTMGRVGVTGTVQAYFCDLVMYNKFLDETVSALQFSLGGVAGAAGTQTWTLPHLKFTSGDHPIQGDGPISLSMPFTAYYDPTSKKSIQVEKA